MISWASDEIAPRFPRRQPRALTVPTRRGSLSKKSPRQGGAESPLGTKVVGIA
jgi:hypothetical protein